MDALDCVKETTQIINNSNKITFSFFFNKQMKEKWFSPRHVCGSWKMLPFSNNAFNLKRKSAFLIPMWHFFPY